jgi:hypothetical protein
LHQRQIIRTKIADLLVAGATAAGTRVFPSRKLPLRKIELPALAVYTLDESVTADSVTSAPRELTRSLNVVIEGWIAEPADSGTTVDDAIDALAEEIETVMHADPYLGDTVGESILSETTVELVEEGDRMMALLLMTYAVTYRTLAPAAPTLDDFETVGAETDLAGAQDPADRSQLDFVVEDPYVP